MTKSMAYLQQDCSLTLIEALEEYTSTYPFLNNNDGTSEKNRWFRNHDITHIIFGTMPFQIRGESINDTWTVFGCDITIRKYFNFFKYVDYNTVINSYLKTYKTKPRVYCQMSKQLPTCCVAMKRAWQMKKKWPWFHPEPYFDQKVNTIRQDFAIKIIDNK